MRLTAYLLCVLVAISLTLVGWAVPAGVAAGIAACIALRRELVRLGALGVLAAEHVAAQRHYRLTMVASPRTRSSR